MRSPDDCGGRTAPRLSVVAMKVLTYNVKMLPGIFGKGTQDLARAEQIATALLARDDDVIALQEVFDETVRRCLVHRLGGTFPHRIEKSGDDWFNEDSGLMLLSRLPFAAEPAFFEWDCKGPFWTSDRWADKGVQLARLRLSDTAEVVLGNVHLQADYAPKSYADVRAGQVEQLARVVDRGLVHAPDPERVAAIVVGDFNIIAGSTEYDAMLQTLRGARDLWFDTHPDAPGYTVDRDVNTMVPENNQKRRIDLALAFDTVPGDGPDGPISLAAMKVTSIGVVRFKHEGMSLSDHDAVAVHVEVG